MTYILTYENNKFDYSNITKDSVNIQDIIHALPRLNRFVGHSSRPYSVGEHSLYCYRMARHLGYSDRAAFLTLIHDFTEAYVGDCPAPLKRLIPEFSVIEGQVESAILEHLGLEPMTELEHEQVKAVDLTMLVLEMKHFTKHDWVKFMNDIDTSETIIEKRFIDDENFQLSDNKFSERELSFMLDYNFIAAYEKVRETK